MPVAMLIHPGHASLSKELHCKQLDFMELFQLFTSKLFGALFNFLLVNKQGAMDNYRLIGQKTFAVNT